MSESVFARDCAAKGFLNPLVVISILTWNDWQSTQKCLESVRRLDYPNFLIVVVDNGSRDGSAEKIKAWARENLGPGHLLAEYTQETALQGGEEQTEEALDRTASPAELLLICNEENLGFTGGNNVSISYALCRPRAADYVLLLNNDAWLEPDCLTQLVGADQRADAGMIQVNFGGPPLTKPGIPARRGRTPDRNGSSSNEDLRGPVTEARSVRTASVDPAPNRDTGNRREALDSHSDLIPVSYTNGAGVLVRRDVLEAVKRFQGSYLDERIFVYLEDFALSLVACNLGYKPHLAKRAIGHHRGMSGSGGKWGPIQFYYGTRNMFYLAENLPELERRRFRLIYPLSGIGRVVKYLAMGRYGSARAALWGMIDAYRGVTGKWREHDRQAGQARHGRFH